VVAQLNPILYLVWLLSISLESIAFAISVVRPNKHVVFRCYLGFCIARSVLLFWASFGHPWTYWYGYWGGTIIEGMLVLLVAAELARRVFRPIRIIPKNVLVGFILLTTFVLALAFAASLKTPDASMRIMAIGRAIERTVNLLLFCGMAMMIGLSDYLGLRWKRHAYGIAAGLTVNLAVSTVVQVIYAPFLMGPAAVLRYLQMAGFIIAEVVWIEYLRKPEPELSPVSGSELQKVERIVAEFAARIGLLKAKHEVVDSNQDAEFVCAARNQQRIDGR
jgi:hypothetical protein